MKPEAAQPMSTMFFAAQRLEDAVIGILDGERFLPFGQVVRSQNKLIGAKHVWDEAKAKGKPYLRFYMSTGSHDVPMPDEPAYVRNDIAIWKVPKGAEGMKGSKVYRFDAEVVKDQPVKVDVSGWHYENNVLDWAIAGGIRLNDHQHTCSTRPGSSGGAVRYNKRVIGIHYGGAPGTTTPNEYTSFTDDDIKAIQGN